MSQEQIAVAIGASGASVGLWEKGRNITGDSLEKIIKYAQARGHHQIAADIKLHFDGIAKVTKVYQPHSEPSAIRLPPSSGTKDLVYSIHEMVDSILQSGDPEATAAMESILTFITGNIKASDER